MPPELLSPAGGFDAALAAFQYGADAVYLGLPRFSARADADNITPERLRLLLAYARTFSPAKKVYVTFNTLVQDAELPEALETLDTLDDLGPDGIIVQDLGVARLARDHFPRLALHASTQLAAHNLDGVLALRDLGFTRVVLARELTLGEIRHIVRKSGTEIEVFVHGALCYSVSGLCLFSSHTAGRSGNRGRCAYCCREAFSVSGGTASSPSASRFPFSMKDLALAPILEEVVATGAHSLKIEGRMKSPLYVACVSDYYRRKLDGRLTPDEERDLVQDLQTVFSRPWTHLYAESTGASPSSIIDPVSIGHRGAPIGAAEAVFRDREGTAWLRFTTRRPLEKHDGLQVDLPDGGKPFGCAVNLLRATGARRTAITLPAGTTVEVALPEQDVPAIPRGATVYCSASQAVRRRYEIRSLRESMLPDGRPADIHVSLSPDGIAVRAQAPFEQGAEVTAEARVAVPLTPSRQPGHTPAAVRKAFERLGDTAWRLGALTLDDPHTLYAPPSRLNEARRAALTALTDAWNARRAARRGQAASAWRLGAAPVTHPAPETPRWTLKLRADAPAMTSGTLDGIETVVLGVGHLPLPALLDLLSGWDAAAGPNRLRLALPLLSREHEVPALKATLRALAESGRAAWECSDLAGARMLREAGLAPVAADWSLYAFNRAAVAELAELGVRSTVLSPENSLANIRALGQTQGTAPARELIVFQHTPLFISETAPCLQETLSGDTILLADRRGRTFTAQHLDGRWITVQNAPYCIAGRLAETGCSLFRIDLSHSPDPSLFPSVIRTVLSGGCPPGAHAANFDRGLA